MTIGTTGFGWIEIDQRRYTHDVVVADPGEIRNRYEGFSGDSHLFTPTEAAKVLTPSVRQLVVGTGQMGILTVPPETLEFLETQGVKAFVERTPQAILTFNRLTGGKCGLFHVTC
jgi:hypothetical protein